MYPLGYWLLKKIIILWLRTEGKKRLCYLSCIIVIPTYSYVCSSLFSKVKIPHRDAHLQISLLVTMISANLERMRYTKDSENKNSASWITCCLFVAYILENSKEILRNIDIFSSFIYIVRNVKDVSYPWIRTLISNQIRLNCNFQKV